MWLLSALVCLWAGFLGAHAASPPTTRPQSESVASSTKAGEANTANAQLAALHAQVTTMKEYHASLLDTVYWALGVTATIAVLLAGFSWFTNFKLYESDKQKLKEDFAAALKRTDAQVEARLNANQVELVKLFDPRIDALATKTSTELGALRAEYVAERETLVKTLESIHRLITSLADDDKENRRRLSLLEATARRIEEHIWEIKGLPVNILITQSQGLESAVAANDEDHVRAVIARMKLTLANTLLPKGEAMPKKILEYIDGCLSTATKIDAIAVSEVRELLRKMKVANDKT